MSNDTFFSYRRHFYLWANLALVVALIIWYVLDVPLGTRSGGSVFGYTAGGIATAGILYLSWYGIRKRSYHARYTTLKGTLAAHVWLGIALSIIVPLHCGFQFGINVHTLAYVLMMIVVISGVWGAIYYQQLAPAIQSHRGGGRVKDLVEQVHLVSAEMESLAAQQSDQFITLLKSVDVPFEAKFWKLVLWDRFKGLDTAKVGQLVAALPEGEKEDGLKLVQLSEKKRALVTKVQDELAIMTKMRLWLLIHLPLSMALLVVLAVHIFVVFFYW